MKTFEIIKKNRKYFSAKIGGKIPCKILIDSNSENLEIGNHQLLVDDISVRSSYGTDLIYKLSAAANDVASAGITTLRTPFYNKDLVNECKKLGGSWDAKTRAWIFSGIVADKVEELDEIYNSSLIPVEITFDRCVRACCEAVFLAGFKIAAATGRDSGAKMAEGVALIEGDVDSGGSMKNWVTSINEGTKIRMEVPELLIQDLFSQHYITVVRLDTNETVIEL